MIASWLACLLCVCVCARSLVLWLQPTLWRPCGGVEYTKNVGSIIPYIEDFFTSAPTMRILYYAGDIDIATVPFAGTQRCLETMQRPITSKWRPWIIDREVAGYVEVYDTYTFATLKAAGHGTPPLRLLASNRPCVVSYNQPPANPPTHRGPCLPAGQCLRALHVVLVQQDPAVCVRPSRSVAAVESDWRSTLRAPSISPSKYTPQHTSCSNISRTHAPARRLHHSSIHPSWPLIVGWFIGTHSTIESSVSVLCCYYYCCSC